ncbi:MAG: hypothetical protein NC225_08580 [Clostridium sp.]|nr:hypothetical protein [Clostridium sp.]MCM1460074.1 hypothetical protein [Bacteroides sp.]
MKSGRSQSILTISAVAFVAAFLVDMYLIFAAASNIELIIAVSLIVIVDTYFLVDGILAKVDEVVSINIDKQNELTKVEKGIYSVAKREEISRGQSMSAIIDVVLDMKDENERMAEQLMEQDKLLAKLFIKKDMDNTTKMVNSNERIAVLLAQMASANAKSQDESIEILNEMQKRLEESRAAVDAEYAEFGNEYQKLEDEIKSQKNHRKLERDALRDDDGFEGEHQEPNGDMNFGEADPKPNDEMDFEETPPNVNNDMNFGEVDPKPNDEMGFEETPPNPNADNERNFEEAEQASDYDGNVSGESPKSDNDMRVDEDTWNPDGGMDFGESTQEWDDFAADGNYRELSDEDIKFDSHYRGAEESYRELDDDDIWFEEEYPKSDGAGVRGDYRQSGDDLGDIYGKSEEAATKEAYKPSNEAVNPEKEYRRFDDTMFEKIYPNLDGIRDYRELYDTGSERRYFKADDNDTEFDGIYQRLDEDIEFDGIYRRLDDDAELDGRYQRLGDENTELDDIYRRLNEAQTEINDIYQQSKTDNKEQGVAQYPHLRMMEL